MKLINNLTKITNSLGEVGEKLDKSMEKLSTGQRINSAADDAAGLAISEGMRSQIRGINQGSQNVQKGINMIDVAEGAMSEIHSILQKMRELTIQAANDTYTDTDREKINIELETLKEEIDNISYTAQFNEIDVLRQGNVIISVANIETTTQVEVSTTTTIQTDTPTGGMPDWVVMDDDEALKLGETTDGTYDKKSTATIDFTFLDSYDNDTDKLNALNELIDTGFYTTCCTCTRRFSIIFTDDNSEVPAGTATEPIIEINIQSLLDDAANVTSTDLVNAIITAASANSSFNHFTQFDQIEDGKLLIYDTRDNQQPNLSIEWGVVKDGYSVTAITDPETVGPELQAPIVTVVEGVEWQLPVYHISKNKGISVDSSSHQRCGLSPENIGIGNLRCVPC